MYVRAACMAQMVMLDRVDLDYVFVLSVLTRRDKQTDRPLDAQPPPGGTIRDLAPTDQCVSVCRCVGVVSPGTRSSRCENVCVCARWDVGTGSRAIWRARERKLLIGGGAKALVELHQASNLTPLTGHCNRDYGCDCDGDCKGSSTSTTIIIRSTAEHNTFWFLCAIPPGPNAVHHAIHQTCLGSPQTTDQVLGNQSAPCFERGRHLRYEVCSGSHILDL